MANNATLSGAEIDTFFDEISHGRNTATKINIYEAFYRAQKSLLASSDQPRASLSKMFSRGSHFTYRTDVEKPELSLTRDASDAFLYKWLEHCPEEFNKPDFRALIGAWNIPSRKTTTTEQEIKDRQIPIGRRLRAFLSIDGPKILLITLVVSIQAGCAVWQIIDRLHAKEAREAFGWGLVFAKTFAGLLYPTLFLMILSMSRYFTTYMRRFRIISQVANWDRVQSFHIWMAVVALIAATLHGVGHLTGTFLYASQGKQEYKLSDYLMKEYMHRPYTFFLISRFGWTGIASLGLFWIIALLSTPWVRKRSYESFQLAHLLGYPLVGLLLAHGTAKLIQYPILGYWLALPALFVLLERFLRIYRSFRRIPARIQLLDDDVVSITFQKPPGGAWSYKPGQYVLVQIPVLSFWQWHPYTISSAQQDTLKLHVKTNGKWSSKLRTLPLDRDIFIGIDGPFGAPAQRFFDCDRAIVIASGVGITPFSAILSELEQALRMNQNPWSRVSHPNYPYIGIENSLDSFKTAKESQDASSSASSETLSTNSIAEPPLNDVAPHPPSEPGIRDRSVNHTPNPESHLSEYPENRVDFHWTVRERHSLLWFTSLLNRVIELSENVRSKSLDLNIRTYVTMRGPADITTHICRYLLDSCGSSEHPFSVLTGLRTRTDFGRPDFAKVLYDFHVDMLRQGWTAGHVGVFFCGSPTIGRALSDICTQLTLRSRIDGSNIVYELREEVFG